MIPNYEFLNYKSTPGDPYLLGLATVRLMGKIILRFKHVKTKDGTGDFFTAASYSITDNGEKKYLPSFMLDSRADEELLMDFVREGYRKSLATNSVYSPSASVTPMQGSSAEPTAIEQGLPF